MEIDRRDPQEKFVLVRDNDTGRWTIVEPRTLRADKAAVTNLIQQVFDATPEKNIDKAPNLGAWGLEPPDAVVTLKKANTNEFKLDIGKTTSGGNDALVYVLDPARPKDPMGVKKNRLDAVLKPLDDFRDTELLAGAIGDVQSVELTEDKETVGWKKDDRGHWMYSKPKQRRRGRSRLRRHWRARKLPASRRSEDAQDHYHGPDGPHQYQGRADRQGSRFCAGRGERLR